MKKLLIVMILLASVLFIPPSIAGSKHCVRNSGLCSTDLGAAIIAGEGEGDMKWKSSIIRAGKDYLCYVVYLNPQDSGFVAKSGHYGIIPGGDKLLTNSLMIFYVTARYNGAVGFLCDGTKAKGPKGQTYGPQITLACTSNMR